MSHRLFPGTGFAAQLIAVQGPQTIVSVMVERSFGLRSVAPYRLLVLVAVSGFVGSCSQVGGTGASTAVMRATPEVEVPIVAPASASQRKALITVASWYGPGFEGHKTALGEVFHQRAMTAASTIIPLGSRAKVTNLDNGRIVAVRITDCGPYVAGRDIDLSRGAAKRLGFTRSGTRAVRIEVLDGGTTGDRCTKPSNPRTADPRSHERKTNQA
jgi:rare lipoprotein A (peptidoglycan hydrolase)